MLDHLIHCDPEDAPGETLDDLEEKADDAEKAIDEGSKEDAKEAVRDLASEIDDLKAQLAQLSENVESRAAGDHAHEHEHDLPPALQEFHRELDYAEKHEYPPEEGHKRYRKVF